MNGRPLAVLVLAALVVVVAGGTVSGAEPGTPTPGDPDTLEVQLTDGSGTLDASYQIDTSAGSINVTYDGGATWENSTLPDPHETALAIQWAVDNSTATNDTVLIGPGTYNGSVTVLSDGRTLRASQGPSVTTLARGSTGAEDGINVSASSVTIANLTVAGYSGNTNHSIYFDYGSSNNTLTEAVLNDSFYGIEANGNDHTISNNSFSWGHYGIWMYNGDDSIVANNSFSELKGVGVRIRATTNASIRDNTIRDNRRTASFIGVGVYTSQDTDVRRNEIGDNHGDGIRIWSGSANNSIDGNNVSNHRDYGIVVESGPNVVANNTVNGNGEDGVLLDVGDVVVRNNTVANNGNGIHVHEVDATTLVGNDASSNTEFGIQLNASNSNSVVDNTVTDNGWDGIWADGNRNEFESNTVLRNRNGIYFLGSDTDLHDNTVVGNSFHGISGEGDRNYHSGNNVSENTFSGLSVTGADATVANTTALANDDHGIWLQRGSNHTVSNVTAADNGDSGIRIEVGSSSVTNGSSLRNADGVVVDGAGGVSVADLNASQNTRYGVRVNDSTDARLERVESAGNVDHGVWITNGSNRTEVASSTIGTNSGRGVYVENSSDVLVHGSSFESQLYFDGALRPTARNNTLTGTEIVVAGGSDDGLVEDNAIEAATYGVHLTNVGHGVVRNNSINGSSVGVQLSVGSVNFTVSENRITNAGTGIEISTGTPGGNAVHNNSVRNSTVDGIWVATGNNSLGANVVVDGDQVGINVTQGTNNTLADNEVRRNADHGIQLVGVEWTTVESNDASDNDGSGIRLSDANRSTVVSNTVTANVQDGIGLDGARNNTVERNGASANTGSGVAVSDSHGNTVLDNDVYDNGFGVVVESTSSENTLQSNHVHDNGYGVSMSTGAANNSIVDNNVSANTGSGFLVSGAPNNTFTGTVANDNGDWGVVVDGAYGNEFHQLTAIGNGDAAYEARNVVQGTNAFYGLDVGAAPGSGVTYDVEARNVSIAAFAQSVGSPGSDLNAIGGLLNVTNTTSPATVTLAIHYTNGDASGLDESTIGLWNYTNATGNWTEVAGASADTGANTVSATLTDYDTLGLYAQQATSSSGGSGGGGGGAVTPIQVSFHDVDVSDAEVRPGETVTVTLTVRNEDDRSGVRELELKDGLVVLDAVSVALTPDEERRVTFEGSIDETGTYDFAIDGQSVASITVSESASESTEDVPDEGGDEAETGTGGTGGDGANDGETDGGDSTDGDDAAGDSTDEADGDGGGPSPVLLVGVVLVVGAGGLGAYLFQDELLEFVEQYR